MPVRCFRSSTIGTCRNPPKSIRWTAKAILAFISNDSGGMHLAAAAGVPVLAIFGATDETATAPLGLLVRIVKKPVDCSPCKLRECPTDHRCMLAIEAGDVLQAARAMLQA